MARTDGALLRVDSWAAIMTRVGHRCNPTAPAQGLGRGDGSSLDAARKAAASAALIDMRCSAAACGDFASWLRRHVLAVVQDWPDAPHSWQWNLTCVTWAVHAAGADNSTDQQQECRALGILEATARQLPFRAWRQGRSGLDPGVTIPGMRAQTANHRRRLGLCGLQLSPGAVAALDRLVAIAGQLPSARTRASTAEDVEMAPPDAPPAQRADPTVGMTQPLPPQPSSAPVALGPERASVAPPHGIRRWLSASARPPGLTTGVGRADATAGSVPPPDGHATARVGSAPPQRQDGAAASTNPGTSAT